VEDKKHKTHSNMQSIRLPTFVGPIKFTSHYLHLLGQQTWLPIFLLGGFPAYAHLPSDADHARPDPGRRRPSSPRPCRIWRSPSSTLPLPSLHLAMMPSPAPGCLRVALFHGAVPPTHGLLADAGCSGRPLARPCLASASPCLPTTCLPYQPCSRY